MAADVSKNWRLIIIVCHIQMSFWPFHLHNYNYYYTFTTITAARIKMAIFVLSSLVKTIFATLFDFKLSHAAKLVSYSVIYVVY